MNDLRGVIRYIILVLGFAFLAACEVPGPGTPEAPPNRWADERLWPILEAQEHRDTDALCALLKHEASEVRDAAALAFASVQDTSGIPCLMGALGDTSANVRAAAVFALGFVADSLTIERMAELAINERDSTVQRAYLSASFLAMQRKGMLKDPQAIIHFLQSSSGQDRARAADALRRLPDTTFAGWTTELQELMRSGDAEVRALLLLIMKHLDPLANTPELRAIALGTGAYAERVNALRVLVAWDAVSDQELLLHALSDPAMSTVAMDFLQQRSDLDADRCLRWETQVADTNTRIALLGLAMQHGDEDMAGKAGVAMERLVAGKLSTYQRAEVLGSYSRAPRDETLQGLLFVLRSSEPAPLKQAAFQGAVRIVREIMMRSRYADPAARYSQLGEVVRSAIRTRDEGLICAAAELLLEEDPEAIGLLFDRETESWALSALLPIRDLEARILLANVAAKRDGLPPPTQQAPPFNHPIDKEKLRALPQGQRYRITTTKGSVILATDVNDCPGSSLAFDSLVTAGYYNGKAFHRLVPNFVVQGGCPRGDGYGGMPYTLRTEIGRKLFTAGSIGLASAGRDTESCQFFITHSATPHLDGRYTRFGEVVEGMDVVWRLQVGDVMEKVERVE
jgi:cyclophilin family peptidyl-prolyl cis-trans isomerase